MNWKEATLRDAELQVRIIHEAIEKLERELNVLSDAIKEREAEKP